MKKYRELLPFAALLLLLCFAMSGCTQPDASAPTTLSGSTQPDTSASLIVPGSNYSKRVRIVSDLKLAFNVPNADHQESDMVLDYHVTNVDEQGTAQIEVTIAQLKASARSLQFSFAYDSDKDSGPQPPKNNTDQKQRRYHTAFTGIQGSKYKALMDAQGRVLKLFDIDDRIKPIISGSTKGNMFGGDQVAMLLSETSLKEYVALGAIESLNQPNLQPGHKWTHLTTIHVPRASATSKRFCTLDSLETVDGKQVAAISYDIKNAPEPATPEDQAALRKSSGGFDIVSILGNGKIRYSITDNHLIRLNEAMRVGITTATSRTKKAQAKSFYVVKRTIEFIDTSADPQNQM